MPILHRVLPLSPIMNISQEMDFHYKTKARRVMVYFKFDALYR